MPRLFSKADGVLRLFYRLAPGVDFDGIAFQKKYTL